VSRALSSAAFVVAAFAADLAHACPSCASPLEENRQAFVDTTIFLTLLPLAMIGGFVWWVRRRSRAIELEQKPAIAVPETLLRDAGRFSEGR
jgi:hypothetical protein